MKINYYIGYTIKDDKRYYLTSENCYLLNNVSISIKEATEKYGAFYIDNTYYSFQNSNYYPLYFPTTTSNNYKLNQIKDINDQIVINIDKLLSRFNNPFIKSLDNKRYYTFDCYSKRLYGKKITKIPLDGPFSCPNRDGKISKLGCTFCYGGSNAFPNISNKDLLKQYQQRKEIYLNKWQDSVFYAYFQSYSNTYANIDFLKDFYQPFLLDDEIKGLVIATRCDCLDQQKIDWLNSLTKIKPIWLEIGLQSTNDNTLKEMNRGHSYKDFLNIIDLLKDTDIMISVHLINGWPSESKETMLETAKKIGQLPINAVKFHMLHVCKNTPLAITYQNKPFNLLTEQQYVELVAKQITYLSKDMIIERLTGDSIKEVLIAPDWTIKKVNVINDIDKQMLKNNYYQSLNHQ